jgi:hypothetical protein
MTTLSPQKALLGCVQRRPLWLPTWRGWLVVLVLLAGIGWLLLKTLPALLTLHHPIQTETLVVEGWVPDYGLEAAALEFKRGLYKRLYVTGGPLEKGVPLSQFKTYAELGAAVLAGVGMDPSAVEAVPAPEVQADRTFNSACALRKVLQQLALPHRLNVISVGPHSRRTRLLFEKAFGDDWQIGIISVPDQSYDIKRWYRSSNGVRNVLSEAIAYVYARLLFREPRQTPDEALPKATAK